MYSRLRDDIAYQVRRFGRLVPLLVASLLGAPVVAQTSQFDQTQPPAVNIQPPTAPGDTEILHAERGAPATPAVPALEAPLDPDRYICGRGDIFELNLWGAQNLKLHLIVDSEGRAFIAKVGYVDVAGKTLSQVRELVRRDVKRFYPGLQLDLSLIEPRTFLVHVVKNVVNPGVFPAHAVERVASVLGKAGGIAPGGSRRRIEIQHRDGSRTMADLVLYGLTGDTSYNPTVLDGDVVSVPFEEFTVVASGAVHRPGRYELTSSKDVEEMLRLAGGLSSDWTPALPLRIIRRTTGDVHEQILVSQQPSGPELHFALKPDDGVAVPTTAELQKSVVLVGALAGVSASDQASGVRRVPFVEGDTVRTLLERAGGIGALADLKRAYIYRVDRSVERIDLQALLVERQFLADKPVHIGDQVVVPFQRRQIIVQGAVFVPSAIPYDPAFSVTDYISLAGGENRLARPIEDVRVVSAEGKSQPFAPDLRVQPGDTIVVPERNFSRPEVVQLAMGAVGILLSGIALFAVLHR